MFAMLPNLTNGYEASSKFLKFEFCKKIGTKTRKIEAFN